jgi:hypothetical protein
VTEPSERDVRALLAGLDAGPLPELDVDAIMRGGRRYRRRQAAYRAVVSLVVVAVAVGVVTGVARLSAGPAPRPVTSPTPTSSPGPTGSPSPSGSATPTVTASFTATGSMSSAHGGATATLLPTGRVLIAGGSGNHGTVLASAELYDPATGQFTPTGSMSTPRSGATATLLADGRVLIAGGGTNGGTVSSAELYDPATGRFTPTGAMTTPRVHATATLRPNGTVLIAGGVGAAVNNAAGGWLSSAELYDPVTGRFTAIPGLMSAPRAWATATLLPNGWVLIAGGTGPGGRVLSSAELTDGGGFIPTGPMTTPREYVNATPLPDGRVLFAGGIGGAGGYDPLSSAELYDPTADAYPATGTFTPTGSMPSPRFDATATLLADGRVLIAGGNVGVGHTSGGNTVSSAELYDPATGTFAPTAPMTTARYGAMAVQLPDGRVLIAGGAVDGKGALASAELYQPGPNPTPSQPRPAAGTAADFAITPQLGQLVRDSYYQAYLADPAPRDTFGPAGQPESAIRLPSVDHAGVIYGATPAEDNYWVVADICMANPASGCQDGGAVNVFHRVGPTGLYAYTLDPQHVIDVCSVPTPLLQRWYPGGILPAGIRCPQPSLPTSGTP